MQMLTLEHFKKLANKEHDLVLMLVTEAFTPWNKGDLAGFQPEAALDAYTKGFAVPCDKDGKELALKKAAAVPSEQKKDGETLVPIPEEWEGLHHLQQVKLAKAITGRDDISKKEDAVAAIRAEIERRAAGQSQA